MQDRAAEPQTDDAPSPAHEAPESGQRERATSESLGFPPSGEKGWG
jgi:hypothetical protein